MQAYGNLFQGRENVSYVRGNHAFKAGAEVRLNRDTTYFGISPNGEYDFGGGTPYSPSEIKSQSRTHEIQTGDALPHTVSALLPRTPFPFTPALAPSSFSHGRT